MHFPLYEIPGAEASPGGQLALAIAIYLAIFLFVWATSIADRDKRRLLINLWAFPLYVGVPLVFGGWAVIVPMGLLMAGAVGWGLWALLTRTRILLKAKA